MEFKTHYNASKFPKSPELNSGEILVETAGYITAEQRITNLMLAGQRLVEHRKSAYDFEAGKEIDEDFYDPTRRKNYDMADAFQDELALIAKLRQAGVKPPETQQELSQAPEKTSAE